MKIERKTIQLNLPEQGFKLVSGDWLKEIEFACEAYGKLAEDRRNVILICHALTGDAHAAGTYGDSDTERPGWWDGFIGPGKGVDTDRFYVICTNVLGGCSGTSGPCSINPATGRVYGATFPFLTIEDTVHAEKLLLDQLGIRELYAVIGGSMGGMRALQWSISYPDYVRRCVCIASAASLSPQALAFDVIGRQAIESDPEWEDGAYAEKGGCPRQGLGRARQIGHVTYLSSASMAAKFGRDKQAEKQDKPEAGKKRKFESRFEVESYLTYQAQKFVDRFDANSYLYICRMVDLFDLNKAYGSLRQAFAETNARFLIVSISSDWLFPPSQQLELTAALLAERKAVNYFQINSPYGHDAFLIEYEILNRGVRAFLQGETPASVSVDPNYRDAEEISGMLEQETRVLDVGSGDGRLMLNLQQRKAVDGVCLDLSFDAVVRCMEHGLCALHLDADTAFPLIESDTFDAVLLNQTIQQLHSALGAIRDALRIAPRGIIGFPNFAYLPCRLELFLRGRLPVSESLPYQWYNTPNIHLVTVRDFRQLCQENNICLEQIAYIVSSPLLRVLLMLGLVNLGAERAIARISRGYPGCCSGGGPVEKIVRAGNGERQMESTERDV